MHLLLPLPPFQTVVEVGEEVVGGCGERERRERRGEKEGEKRESLLFNPAGLSTTVLRPTVRCKAREWNEKGERESYFSRELSLLLRCENFYESCLTFIGFHSVALAFLSASHHVQYLIFICLGLLQYLLSLGASWTDVARF